MAKGQHLSHYQQGIVKRYYANLDTITLQKLQETVSELYLLGPSETDRKKADKLWKSALAALAKSGADPARIAKVTTDRNVQTLATLVNDLAKQ